MRKVLFILFSIIPLVISGQSTYYVSTAGSDAAAGTIGAPWATMQKAVSTVIAGDVVFFRSGVYSVFDKVTIWPGDGDGAEGSVTFYGGYPADIAGGDSVVFDYSEYVEDANVPLGTANNYSDGIEIRNGAGFVHFKDFIIRNVKQHNNNTECNAIRSSGGHNLTFEKIIVHDIGGRGMFHETPWGYPNEPVCGYDTTRYINCDVYRCADSLPYTSGARLGNQADGIKTYGNTGSVIYYTGCRVWDVADDGWDTGNGTIMHFDNCWSFRNGLVLEGDGDGFKLGSHLDSALNVLNPIIKYVRNCIAAENDLGGFRLLEYWDYYRTNARLYNNLAYENDFTVDSNTDRGDVRAAWRNNISYRTDGGRQFGNVYEPVIIESHNSWDWIVDYPGWEPTDTVTVTAADFVSLDITQLDNPRQADGSLPVITFGHLAATSDLINAGKNVGLPYDGTAPDIGAFEYDEGLIAPLVSTGIHTAISIRRATARGTVTSDGGATVTERGICYSTSANPTTSNSKIVVAGTTGAFTASLAGLVSNTTYHVRSYAINSEGTSYGADEIFTTPAYSVVTSSTGKVYVRNGKVLIIR